jgi:hypothetical protein
VTRQPGARAGHWGYRGHRGRHHRRPGRARWRGAARRGAWLLGLALLSAGLFTAYLHLSQAYPENSDEANILLMAADMAHGNWLLHGWNASDVPFITTELPPIALLTVAFGLRLGTAHIAAALTYTLVVLTAMALARGRARGARALARMLVALAIMAAPQPGVGVFVLVLSVGHIGTAAAVMLTWLVLERCPPVRAKPGAPGGRLRRYGGAVLVALLLAWALTADPLVAVIAVIPLALVAAARREWPLVVAAGAGYLLAVIAAAVIRALGGYYQQPVPYAITAPATWWWHARATIDGLLAMFGADYVPGPQLGGLDEAIAALRVAGVVLAAWGALATARRMLGYPVLRRGIRRRRPLARRPLAARLLATGPADLVSQLLLVGIVADLGAYVTSTLANASVLNAREVAPVLPFAAALAGRALGERLLAGRVTGPPRRARAADNSKKRPRGDAGARAVRVLGAVFLAGSAAGLGLHAAAPPAPDPYAKVEAYLEGRHLTSGLSGYWQASYITVDTGGKVTLRAVVAACLQPYRWESKPGWYRPGPARPATFILSDTEPGYFRAFRPTGATLRQLSAWYPGAGFGTFGAVRLPGGVPGRAFLVHVYPADLMAQLPRLRSALQAPGVRCGG